MINIMVTLHMSEKLSKNIKENVLNDILSYFGFDKSSVSISVTKRNGNYVVLENGDKRNYVCLSSENDGRNSFLSQYLSTAYNHYYFDESGNKDFSVYLQITDDRALTPYHKFFYNALKTLGVEILNIEKVGISPVPFASVKALKNGRNASRDNNSSNSSSFFNETPDGIEFYGKVFGANGKESTFMCLVLSKLSEDKPVTFYMVKDNDTEKLSTTDKTLLEANNVSFDLATIEFDDKDKKNSQNGLRNKTRYFNNLNNKFGNKKACYFCGTTIEKMLIAAHIHRVADIKTSGLTLEEQIKEATDGENGLWLCRNHDVLFEHGYLYFDGRKLKIHDSLTSDVKTSIRETIPAFRDGLHFLIKEEHYTKQMATYIKKHSERIVKKFSI